jgi:maleylpyruvate isomerase
MRVHRIPFSTNVERVALALAHKGLDVEWVDHDPDDRSAIRALSGQELVPVLEIDGGTVIADSTRIVEWLEAAHPEARLYPRERARAAEVRVFVAWFNRVWKRPPNLLAERPADPDAPRWAAEVTGSLEVFEALLGGRDFLMGDELSAADVIAFPFLKYGLLPRRDGDTDPFHAMLAQHLPVEPGHPLTAAWIRRVDELPRA